MAYVPIMRKIEDDFGGSVKLRMAVSKAVSYIFVFHAYSPLIYLAKYI